MLSVLYIYRLAQKKKFAILVQSKAAAARANSSRDQIKVSSIPCYVPHKISKALLQFVAGYRPATSPIETCNSLVST